MRFLLDQDVYAITARFLRGLDHDVATAADIGAARATDEDLLLIAQEQGRLFMTRDRDFGGLVFVRDFGAGVIYLRSEPSIVHAIHEELERVLQSYTEEDLQKASWSSSPAGIVPTTFGIETDYCATYPPSTVIVCPVINDAASEQSQTTVSAISSGLPKRPMGCLPINSASRSSLYQGEPSTIGVRI